MINHTTDQQLQEIAEISHRGMWKSKEHCLEILRALVGSVKGESNE